MSVLHRNGSTTSKSHDCSSNGLIDHLKRRYLLGVGALTVAGWGFR